MKTYSVVTCLISLLLGSACGADTTASHGATSSSVGNGGAAGDATSSTGGTGGAGQGGSGGMTASGTGGGAVWCDGASACDYLNDPLLPCWSGMCVHGACDRVPLPLGTPCNDHNPAMVCDGIGVCRDVFEYGGTCYVRPDGVFPASCPTCDDGDPCTTDACVNDTCTHEALPEGHMCGPWFTCQTGKCCPHPDTVP